ncbi:MAG: trehalose-phosphatase [Actinomycetota bacterium]|nr:trehalose-phosphatase [Actinomycetota bacterium]
MEDDRLRPFIETPESCALFTDFDGTLSEIVDDPAAARPMPGAVEALGKLARRLALVGIVSGRSAQQLLEWLGPDVEIWGVHGAERVVGGRVEPAEGVAPYLARMQDVRDEARRRLSEVPGILVEDKRSVIGLHYRQAQDPAAAAGFVEGVARELASAHDLSIGTGRMVVELRPPLAFSKADVVRTRTLQTRAQAVAFIGDDLVDLPAFETLDELEAGGRSCLRVGVSSDEAPDELLVRADLVVQGPRGVVSFLESLVAGL